MKRHVSARRFISGFRWPWILGFVLLAAAGCSGWSPPAKPTTGRNPILAETPDKDETVRGEEDPPIVTLEIGSALHEKKLSSGDDLPGSIIIPTTNLSAVPVTSALQAILSGTDVSLSWDAGTFDDHLVTVMNLSGPLPQVVNKVCAAARVFCAYRHGSLELKDKETFIVALPPIAKSSALSGNSGSSGSSGTSGSLTGNSSSSANSGLPSAANVAAVATAAGNTMADAISDLSNDKAKIDEQGGNIIYTTDVSGEDRVREYIEQLRNGRPLVVLQLYIWEVQLAKENTEGINWNSLKAPDIGGHFEDVNLSAAASAFPSVAGGATFGAVTAGRISASLIAAFLSTQGRTQTVSNPQITFVSGSSAQFTVGGQTNYISSIGQLVTASNVSGTGSTADTSGVGTNTVSTASLTTGLSIGVSGAFENGVVFANFSLSITNLQSLNPTSSGGQTIDLPTTTNRQVSTIIRVRPGDNLVMAGMVSSSDNNNRQGIPLPGDGSLPMYGNDSFQNTELVIMVHPSVVLFSDKKAIEEAKRRESMAPLPAAYMIDKDGSKELALPGRDSAPVPVVVPPNDVPKTEMGVGASPTENDGPLPQLRAAPLKAEHGAFAPQATTMPQNFAAGALAPTAPDPEPAPMMPTPVADTNDGAPVDQRLMQRGFSHAFNDLLQPSPGDTPGAKP